jgi:hypothetical protein
MICEGKGGEGPKGDSAQKCNVKTKWKQHVLQSRTGTHRVLELEIQSRTGASAGSHHVHLRASLSAVA